MAKVRSGGRRSIAANGRRVKLTIQESTKRVREFAKRKENFIAAVRKGKDRSLSA